MSQYKKILIAIVLVLLLTVLLPEGIYQFRTGIGQWQMLLLTHRMALMLHVLGWTVILWCFHFLLKRFTDLSSGSRRNWMLAAATVALAFVGAEAVVRFSGHMSGYMEKRFGFYWPVYHAGPRSAYHVRCKTCAVSLKGKDFTFERTTNSLGIAFPEPPLQKDTNEIRILALGDSFTEGDGAPQDSTWVKAMERKLQQFYPAWKITCINAGVSGSDPVFEYHLLKNKLLQYQPDVVIVGINASDVEDIIVRGGLERFVSEDTCVFKKGPWWDKLYAVSHIFRMLVHLHYNHLLLTAKEYQQAQQKAIAIITDILNRYAELGRQNDFRFISLLMPVRSDFERQRFESLQALAESLTAQDSLPVINLYDALVADSSISARDAKNFYWEEGHPNSAGYILFGQKIAESLIGNRVPDKFNGSTADIFSEYSRLRH
ncbi:MAG: hypothetical protein KatS3mg031_2694 [Chitinophagales bacterium]|nr:MAG: hypothetical protein KatS3mg031_2694 [Chitinophagales bacterium]